MESETNMMSFLGCDFSYLGSYRFTGGLRWEVQYAYEADVGDSVNDGWQRSEPATNLAIQNQDPA